MAKNPLNQPGFFGSEDIEKMNKDREQTFRKNKEVNDMLDMMKELGMQKFREMFGQATIDQLKEIATEEAKLAPIKEKIRLQSKLKHDYPMCEKCEHWGDQPSGGKPCPWDREDYEKNITFETGEVSQNPFPVEVCDQFNFKKG
jgi:hypothetical protein